MFVQVFNDGEEVFVGSLDNFLKANEGDLWLEEKCEGLYYEDSIEFEDYHIGHWKILRI